MDGIIRIGSVNYEFEDDGEYEYDFDVPNLVDNSDFHSEKALIAHIVEKLKVSSDIVTISG